MEYNLKSIEQGILANLATMRVGAQREFSLPYQTPDERDNLYTHLEGFWRTNRSSANNVILTHFGQGGSDTPSGTVTMIFERRRE